MTNHIFGGSYNSLLNTEVRIKSGLTYGAIFTFSAHVQAGSLAVETYTRTKQTIPALKLVMDMLGKMSRGELTQKNLDFARDYMAGVYPIQSETAEQVAGPSFDGRDVRAASGLQPHLPRQDSRHVAGRSAARSEKVFRDREHRYRACGQCGQLSECLKSELPNAQYTEIPADQLDPLSDDLRAAKQAKAEATPEALAAGKQILLAAAQAAGGDALKPVATIRIAESERFMLLMARANSM